MGRPNLRWRFLLAMLPALLATSAATDTMNPGDTLRDTPRDIRISPGEGFQLGFFPPPTRDNLLKLRYLGIWSALFSREFVVIWVANRERGINGTTGVLSFHGNGSLVLSDARGDVYWSTGAAAGVSSPVARLLDNGNFVVTGSGGGAPAWQSFDYPTDSLLPGMKLGWDLRTGMNRNITSWRSPDDPAPGQYSMVMDVRGVPQLILMLQGATPVWRTGPWIGDGFSGMPEMKTDGMFNFSFHNGADEVYYRLNPLKNTILTRLVVSPTGVVKRVVSPEGFLARLVVMPNGVVKVMMRTWGPGDDENWKLLWSAPKDPCDKFSQCGPFGVCDANSSPMCRCLQGFERPDGCARRTPLNCRNGTDGFAKVGVAKLPDTSGAVVNPTMGLDECRAACLSNCSCTAYAGTGAGCTLWGGNLTDIMGYAVGGSDLYVRVAAADPDPRLNPALTNGSESNSSQEKKSASSTSKRVLLPVVGAVLATVVLGWICWFLWRRQRRRGRKMTTERVLRKNGDVVAARSGTSTAAVEDLDDLPLMDFTSIAAATDGFSAENKLGEGGFGPVYVGRMGDGQEVAVKRLARNSAQGMHEFKNEVVLIAKLQHRNLVRLLGCCIQGEEKILVYEYMPNKSLDAFLFDKTKSSLLDWNIRYKIIKGIAKGLLYLHQDSRLRIIHRDLKASNVLLDKEMNPKISDFGMARMFGGDQTEANTRKVVGTHGYMSPEYLMEGLFSMKSDVFSFGVVVLEIVSGERNRAMYLSDPNINLLGYAWSLWKASKWMEMVDSYIIANSFPKAEVLKCIKVGLLCVQEQPEDRPTMASVVEMWGDNTESLPQPKQPAFMATRGPIEVWSLSKEKLCSINEVTITDLCDGR